MHIKRITTWSELATLEHEWNGLCNGLPFLSWDWLATWWKYYANDDCGKAQSLTAERQLNVLAVYDEADSELDLAAPKLVGIAPWYLEINRIKGNVLRWLGSGEVCTDHVSLICPPGDGERVAAAIADALAISYDDWDRIDLDAVDADDNAVGLLVAALKKRDCLVTREAANACWVLDLPAGWDDYLSSLSKSHRKQLRQLERRVLQAGRTQWNYVRSIDELEAAWPVLVDLHQRRRKSLGEPGCFASGSFYCFHREVVARLLARGELRMSWLMLDGVAAAAEYHLANGHTTYAYQGGVDPNRLGEEPGRLSTILCLRQAIEAGHRRFDFLRGDEPYKAHWRATPRATCDYRVVPNRSLARLRGRLWNVTDALTDLARQGAQYVSFSSGS